MSIRDRAVQMRENAQAKLDARHYDTEVNKGSVNMGFLAARLNERYQKGWRLHTIFEQRGEHGDSVRASGRCAGGR